MAPAVLASLAFVAGILLATPAQAQEGVLCPAEPTDMTFAYGEMVRCTLEIAGDSDLFRFTGAPADVIVILVARASGSILPCLELTAPNNSQTTACGFASTNRISTTLLLGGTFTVRVRDYYFSNSGGYNLALERIVPPSPNARVIQYGQTLTGDLGLQGDLDLFAFSGAAGDLITASTSRVSGSVLPCIELGSPTGVRTTACGFASTNQVQATLTESGVHTLLIRDYYYSNSGGYSVTLQCLTGVCTPSPPPTAVNDAYSTPPNTPLVIAAPGVLANDNSNGGGPMTAAVVTGVSNGVLALASNGGFTYTPTAGFSGVDSFTYRPSNSNGPGNTATVTLTVTAVPPPTALDDAFGVTSNTQLNVSAPGVLGNDNSNGGGAMSATLVTGTSSGALALSVNGGFTYIPPVNFVGTDSFTYRAVNAGGASNTATVTITVTNPTTAQPPTDLVVDSVLGSLVTLRFVPPALGPPPTGFVLKGGLQPGQVLASLPTGHTAPVFTFVAPVGSFFIRMHTVAGGGESGPSNEVPLHVGVPVPPSVPTSLTGMVNGSAMALAWKNTFGGGPPTNVILDVTGSLSGSFSLGPVESFSFPAVPGGSYTFRVRANNAGGTSAASDPVSLSFPGTCSGPPLIPANFLAYKVGATIFVLWDPPETGAAPTQYVLNVTGSFVGDIPTTSRLLSGSVPPGSYSLAVRATNPCGSSPLTPPQVVVVP